MELNPLMKQGREVQDLEIKMTYDKRICDSLNEWVMEEGWQLSRKFMQEIEHEFDCQGKLPVSVLLSSQNLVIKWMQFVLRN